jgi:thioredoxin-like negative regulator of GroEL
LQQKYGAKGLSVLAITSEGKSDTERWVESKGAKYAYAYDKSGALSRYFGVSGIPAAALVNAQGIVVWRGHPGSLPMDTLQQALKGALGTPIFDWPKSAAGVRAAFSKRDFAGAIGTAEKLPEPERALVLDGVKAYVDGQVQIAQAALDEGNLLVARDQSARLIKELGKLEQGAKAKEIGDKVAKVENADKILAALEKLAQADVGKLKKKKDGEKLLDDLRKIAKELPDTYAAKVAQQKLDDLARILPGLK